MEFLFIFFTRYYKLQAFLVIILLNELIPSLLPLHLSSTLFSIHFTIFSFPIQLWVHLFSFCSLEEFIDKLWLFSPPHDRVSVYHSLGQNSSFNNAAHQATGLFLLGALVLIRQQNLEPSCFLFFLFFPIHCITAQWESLIGDGERWGDGRDTVLWAGIEGQGSWRQIRWEILLSKCGLFLWGFCFQFTK